MLEYNQPHISVYLNFGSAKNSVFLSWFLHISWSKAPLWTCLSFYLLGQPVTQSISQWCNHFSILANNLALHRKYYKYIPFLVSVCLFICACICFLFVYYFSLLRFYRQVIVFNTITVKLCPRISCVIFVRKLLSEIQKYVITSSCIIQFAIGTILGYGTLIVRRPSCRISSWTHCTIICTYIFPI